MRIYLFREDIELLNKVCDKVALKTMKDIREHYGLPHTRYISIKSYCDYYRLDKEDVWLVLKSKKAS